MKSLLPFLLSLLFFSCSSDSTHKIQGRWNLITIEYLDAETKKWVQSSWMKNGKGILQYNADGRMSVHFTPEDFEIMSKPDGASSEEQKLEEFKHLSSDYWYVGDYAIVENNEYVTHHRIMHSNPWDWGVKVKRKLDFLGDTLVLTSTEREVNLRLKWVRE